MEGGRRIIGIRHKKKVLLFKAQSHCNHCIHLIQQCSVIAITKNKALVYPCREEHGANLFTEALHQKREHLHGMSHDEFRL